MHYGHPDVFDRIFHITRGGISKASRVINISEDIYSGMAACFLYKPVSDSSHRFFILILVNLQDSTQPCVKEMLLIMNIFRQGFFFYDDSMMNYVLNNEIYRLAREGMSGSIRSLYLKGRLLGAMVNKFSAVMFTDLGNFLISSA